MKKLIVIFFLLSYLNIFSQNYKGFIVDGVGPFKIGTDIGFLMEVMKFKEINCYKIGIDSVEGGIKKYNFIEFVGVDKNGGDFMDINCPDIRIFYIKRYYIACGNIMFNNLFLTFYKGILCKVNCDYSKSLIAAIRVSYGECVFEKDILRYSYLDKQYIELTKRYIWKTDNILINLFVVNNYKHSILSVRYPVIRNKYIDIYNKTVFDKIKLCR